MSAATWCSILASDRATAAWSIKLRRPFVGAMRLAWAAFVHAKAQRPQWTRAEQWAEAEALLRSGRHYYKGAWRTWR